MQKASYHWMDENSWAVYYEGKLLKVYDNEADAQATTNNLNWLG